MNHIKKLIETHYMIYWICTQSFVIIKKKKIVDPMIDFDDYKILKNYDTNYIFQEWMSDF